jgi:hypothetical protein
MKRAIYLAVLGSSIMLGACKKSSPPETDQGAVAAVPAALSDEAIEQSDLPVKEDFEEAAYAGITEDNLGERVDTLTQEIQADQE